MTNANRFRIAAASAISGLFLLGACSSMNGSMKDPAPTAQNPAQQQHYSNN